MLTLFGLVLAIGIVVDDAIVVVENVERNIAHGHDAARRRRIATMDEVGTAVIAISLVLIAVFVPTAFIPGISGQFYLQFAVTIAVVDGDLGLQLADAVAGAGGAAVQAASRARRRRNSSWRASAAALADGFNRGFDRLAHRLCVDRAPPGRLDGWRWSPCSRVFAGLIYATVLHGADACRAASSRRMDQGYAIVVIQLPDGASLARTDAVIQQASRDHPQDAGRRQRRRLRRLLRRDLHQCLNAGVIFAPFDSFEDRLETRRRPPTRSSASSTASLQSIQEAFIIAVPPPPVRGIGNSGGFKMQLQERNSADMRRDPGAGLRDRWARPTRRRA